MPGWGRTPCLPAGAAHLLAGGVLVERAGAAAGRPRAWRTAHEGARPSTTTISAAHAVGPTPTHTMSTLRRASAGRRTRRAQDGRRRAAAGVPAARHAGACAA